VKLQEALNHHITKVYPEISGSTEDLQEILDNHLASKTPAEAVSQEISNIHDFSRENISDSGIGVEN